MRVQSFFRQTAGMIALHQSGERVQENLRPIERIYMQLTLVIGSERIRIKHNRRNVAALPLRADKTAFLYGNIVGNYDRADMTLPKHLKCKINRGNGDDTISRMRQNG